MVAVDQSKKDLILTLVEDEESEENDRENQRKKEGRCLAIVVVLFLIGLAVYHGIPMPNSTTSRLSALITAGIILCLYFLWMWYAAHRRKTKQKDQELRLEKHVSSVLENLNNIKSRSTSTVLTDNPASDPEHNRPNNVLKEFKQKVDKPRYFKNFDRGRCKSNIEIATLHSESSSRKSSSDGDIFIRTYSIA